jgi:gliding motility-associated-like protein
MKMPIPKHLLLLLSITMTAIATGQNLVINPGFEEFAVCPPGYGNGGPLYCEPWVNGNLATADYFNTCATGTDVWIPDNLFGNQAAHTGNGYAGFYTRESSIWREYVQVGLTEPLVAGITYTVSFYVSLADLHCGVENIGAYLSATLPPGNNNIGTLQVTPQIEADLGFITETEGWVLITGCFTAAGGEVLITIGNYYNNANTPLDPNCSTSFASYYYVDDVSVIAGEPGSEIPLDLGDDVTACTSFQIIPEVSGDVSYHWSDGSTDPTLTVSTSGVYVLTVTSGCDIGIDSVEVTINGAAAPVDLGPSTAGICEGDTYVISLDPDAGDYEWQDGSTDPDYIITSPGTYSVTLDDGCEITADNITINVMSPPDPFSLGEDTGLCNGDEINFAFDPNLGSFLWQDGSVTPNYSITTSGTYSLTISNACGSASDEITITNGNAPTVELGPQQVMLCAGEELAIALDPNAGDYTWQDGSHEAAYTINAPGNYSVTVSNGCGSDSDDLVVTGIATPGPFSLGPDTLLCIGDELEFSFDPALGDFTWQDGSSASSYSINAAGTYSLTISNACGEYVDQLEIAELAAPVIDLGSDPLSLCQGEQIVLTFDAELGDFLWQDGSASASYTISNPGTVAVTVSNSCGVATDQIEVVQITPPVVDLGDDLILCPQQLPVTLNAGNDDGVSYVWQDNSTSNQFIVSVAGIYAVTATNVCFSAKDQIEIIVHAGNPQVTLPADQILCEGATFILQPQGVSGEFTWQDGTHASSYIVSDAGTYALTVSNECGVGSDSISFVYIDSLQAPNLGPDVSLCPGEEYVFHAGVSGVVYSWQDGSTADTLIASTAGTYVLHISNVCNTMSDTAILTINGNPPDVDLPSTLSICSGETLQLNAGIAGVTYAWNTGSNDQAIAISTPGWYSVTVSSSCGVDSDSVWITDGGILPIVTLPDTVILCPGEQIMITPMSSNVESWLWHDGSSSPTFSVSAPGLVAIIVSNACGTSTDSVEVAVLPALPGFSLGADTVLCAGESVVLSVSSAGASVLWNNGSVSDSLSVSTEGLFSVNVSNQCGEISDSIYIQVLPELPALSLGDDQFLCPAETILFSPGITEVNYTWQDGSSDATLTVNAPGTITLTLSNACGSVTDTVIVYEDTDGPEVDLGPDITACAGSVVTLEANVLGVTYYWQDGSVSSSYQASTSGLYIVQVSNACGMDTDSVQVDFNLILPKPALGADTTLCEGQSITLQSASGAGTTATWQDGSVGSMFQVMNGGVYTLTESNACGIVSDTVVIDFLAAPVPFDLGHDTVICPGDIVAFYAPVTTNQIAWQDGSDDLIMFADAAQLYSLTISNHCGIAYDDILISIDDREPVITIDNFIRACPDEVITVSAQQPFDASYQWSTGAITPDIALTASGNYIVTVTSACSTAQHEMQFMQEPCDASVYIPNVFSPNGDQVNDIFEIAFSSEADITDVKAIIYDRWGNEVFRTADLHVNWDGTFSGKAMQPGVYAYFLTFDRGVGGKKRHEKYAGDISLVR